MVSGRNPHYTEVYQVQLPDGKKLTVKTGPNRDTGKCYANAIMAYHKFVSATSASIFGIPSEILVIPSCLARLGQCSGSSGIAGRIFGKKLVRCSGLVHVSEGQF